MDYLFHAQDARDYLLGVVRGGRGDYRGGRKSGLKVLCLGCMCGTLDP